MPGHLLLNVTTTCNARCPFCCVLDALNQPSKNMTDAQIQGSLEEGRSRDCTMLGYTGGEPSVHPRIIEIVRSARDMGYTWQSMNTNGFQFRRKQFCRDIIEAGLTSVDLSVHSSREDVQDRMMGRKGAFKMLLEACENLRELKASFKFHISATVVVTRDNHADLRETADFLHSLGIENIRIKYAYQGDLDNRQIIEEVSPYEVATPGIVAALDHLANRPGGFHVTEVPICLLGDHAVFSRNFERTESLVVFRRRALQGDASHHDRAHAGTCERCVLQHLCSRLDKKYEATHGRPAALHAFESADEVEALFDRAEARFPTRVGLIRKTRDAYRQNHAEDGNLRKINVPVPERNIL